MVNIISTVVEDMPNNPEVKGLSPMEAEDTWGEKVTNNLSMLVCREY
jgi:hypothetical protein